jgi:hypothetical protein
LKIGFYSRRPLVMPDRLMLDIEALCYWALVARELAVRLDARTRFPIPQTPEFRALLLQTLFSQDMLALSESNLLSSLRMSYRGREGALKILGQLRRLWVSGSHSAAHRTDEAGRTPRRIGKGLLCTRLISTVLSLGVIRSVLSRIQYTHLLVFPGVGPRLLSPRALIHLYAYCLRTRVVKMKKHTYLSESLIGPCVGNAGIF